MLKRYLTLGLLATMTIFSSPVLAGNQTQGNTGNNNINATNVGKGNRIRIINRTYVIKSQRRAKKILCQSPTNQTQGNAINNSITATNVGKRNRIKITNINRVVQGQSVEC